MFLMASRSNLLSDFQLANYFSITPNFRRDFGRENGRDFRRGNGRDFRRENGRDFRRENGQDFRHLPV